MCLTHGNPLQPGAEPLTCGEAADTVPSSLLLHDLPAQDPPFTSKTHWPLCSANWKLHGRQTADMRRETVEGTLALESETQALGVGPNTIRYQLCDLAISEPESVASSVR